MKNRRIRPSQIWSLGWTTALAFTTRRYRGADRKSIIEVRPLCAMAAFPIYLVTVAKTWFEQSGYAVGTNTVVTVVDRRRTAAVRRRYVVVALVAAALFVGLLVAALEGIAWVVSGAFSILIVLALAGVLALLSGVAEVVRGARAREGKQPSPKAATKRLDPRWYVEGLAQRPNTSGGFEFAAETLKALVASGDGVLTVARDPFVRMVYLRMGFEPTEEHPDVLYRVF